MADWARCRLVVDPINTRLFFIADIRISGITQINMPCQQISSSNSDHAAMKQVRFANNGNVSVNVNDISVVAHTDNEVDTKPDGTGSEDNADLQTLLGPQLKLLPLNDQIRELQTIIRDKWVVIHLLTWS